MTARDPARWSRAELAVLKGMTSPRAIQTYLDSVAYSTDPIYRAPARVLADARAHCFDGATFAAAALRRLGHAPLLVDLGAERDDEHVLAVYRVDGAWGSVSKSNCAGLRFREPIYRSVRELVMSYFEFYFNVESEKSLRTFSVPVNLSRFDALHWTHEDNALDAIADKLTVAKHQDILTRAQKKRLARVDPRTYAAGMLGADEAGLYRPGKAS